MNIEEAKVVMDVIKHMEVAVNGAGVNNNYIREGIKCIYRQTIDNHVVCIGAYDVKPATIKHLAQGLELIPGIKTLSGRPNPIDDNWPKAGANPAVAVVDGQPLYKLNPGETFTPEKANDDFIKQLVREELSRVLNVSKHMLDDCAIENKSMVPIWFYNNVIAAINADNANKSNDDLVMPDDNIPPLAPKFNLEATVYGCINSRPHDFIKRSVPPHGDSVMVCSVCGKFNPNSCEHVFNSSLDKSYRWCIGCGHIEDLDEKGFFPKDK
ncbi:hypothetical protein PHOOPHIGHTERS_3 [Serratia phage vB_SmaS_PhooPhighters]|nr:hypothetical protein PHOOPHIGHTERS_3 [Serratia phage vB_SmaS_PhooPhighters]